MKLRALILAFLTLFLCSFFTGCSQSLGLKAYQVDDLVKNPRVHEGEEISIVGILKPSEDAFRLVSVFARLQGTSDENNVYLINYAAKIEFNTKVLVKGQFGVVNLPVLGSYLVIDAKSVEQCTNYSLC